MDVERDDYVLFFFDEWKTIEGEKKFENLVSDVCFSLDYFRALKAFL